MAIGKKNKQTCKQKIKNNIENGRSVGHKSRYCYTSQADKLCDKLSKKKKQIKTMKIYQFFLSSRGCPYRTKDYILVFLIKKKVCAKISFCAWCVQLWKNYLSDCALGSRQQGYRSYTGSFSSSYAICTLITKRQRYFIKKFF